MTWIDAYFDCVECEERNMVQIDDSTVAKNKKLIMCCCKCGIVNIPQRIEKKDGKNWLPCMGPEGEIADDVVGYKKEAGVTRWRDVNQKWLSRTKFAELHNRDPWTLFCSKEINQDKEICQGFKGRCNGKVKYDWRIVDIELPNPK